MHHSAAERAFQRQCLELLTAAAEAGEATRTDLAYLTDRVLLAEGGQQVCGTQVHRQGGAWRPRNLGDPDGVDARRAAAGRGPLAGYLRGFDDYPVQSSPLKCRGCGGWVPFEPPEAGAAVTVTCADCGLESTFRVSG